VPSSDAQNTLPIGRVRAMVDLAAHRGWDVDALLAQAGIPPTLLSEERSRVTWEQGAELVRRVWLATDDDLLGLGLQPVPRGMFRVVCFGLISAPTLGAGIRRFESFERSLPGFPAIVFTETEGEARLAFLMNPTRLDQIERCARSGGVMPSKSSFFYPKPLSGIALYPMRPGASGEGR